MNNTAVRLLKQNSWDDFNPKSPVRIYHGSDDVTLPFAITENYVNRLRSEGFQNVSLSKLDGKDHFSAFTPMVIQSFLYLETFR